MIGPAGVFQAPKCAEKPHVEVLPARRYYGRRASGFVVLVSGQPHHFVGRTSKKDAAEFADSITGDRDGD